MIPLNSPKIVQVDQTHPGKTYRLDIANSRISGMVDGLDAVAQAVYKWFQTPKGVYPIYPTYGCDLWRLIGGRPGYVVPEAERILTEDLLFDNRITSVTDVTVAALADRLTVRCRVHSIFGNLTMEQEISYV